MNHSDVLIEMWILPDGYKITMRHIPTRTEVSGMGDCPHCVRQELVWRLMVEVSLVERRETWKRLADE